MEKNKVIGICVASLWFSILDQIFLIDSDILFSLPIIIFIITALLASIFVYREKRWAYWLALVLSLLQVGLFIFEQIDTPGLMFWDELYPFITSFSSMLLIRKIAEQGN